jgi:predicted nucleotidyltransferase component of viral defense system
MAATINFSVDELRSYAASAGLGLPMVVKEAYLFELADLLDEYKFVLKGGTAINKVYLKGHQRFSEDLDYDTKLDRAEVRKLITGIGWEVKREYVMGRSIGFLLGYEFEGIRDSVKVDFAFTIKGTHGRMQMSSDFLPISKRTEVYGLKELIAQKEGVFEDRKEWKDLYDLYWLSRLYKDEFIIHNPTKFRDAIGSVKMPKIANAFIPVQKRPNWTELVETLRALCG